MRGIDPRTSCKLSERSTIWGTSPLKKRGAYAISNLSSVNAKIEQSFLLHIFVNLALAMRVINPCVSHISIACSSGWLASLAGSKGAFYVTEMSLIHWLVEYCFLRRFSEVRYTLVFRGSNGFLSKLCTVSDASSCIVDLRIHVFFWSNKTDFRISFFDFRAPLKDWRCGASTPVPLACKASGLPFVLHPRWGNGELMTSEAFLLLMH